MGFLKWDFFVKSYFIVLVTKLVPKFIKSVVLEGNEIWFFIHETSIKFFFKLLKLQTYLQFKMVLDILGIDFLTREKRFAIVYNLLSMHLNLRINIIINISRFTIIPSVQKIYSSAGWLEREVWDMFGIFFEKHEDLRRILTDYGFEGFPLRKDFPLTGYNEVRYSTEASSIVYEHLVIAQEFRYFDFTSPWDFRV